ncbi:MAG: hypothetical protein A3I88_00735 [Candidatus Portnoybacteria bacterium RIFCSPLOWO2_12_FULL_39_9]|uniref:M23ase beta-sheet core domain-containing protein n=1 Tax=Candidatus Portnoybacteria bacterium RIFCSPHIGHO2_12_FULL_38_9 TaxID=1801997 RepID=A0A1G2FER0_9BACT|nr:MAG: hypothetical protein A3H00_02545 [Candidatus Portnoybacteria bacterium RBG_13_40_8]OGZ35634.1 MAG: hypothetical protein A2646_01155 [Candidatus Portnoybacteria bacterium RIFCSPHIGHO2_02_FULL_39_12]OGZ36287.1 MAG: hypothetical protein A3J64_02985 [Candidatus Portnoybacteria bacterium RIFCSPHIGHO2_12_FULL_38_9]OGZ40751.1 MAG: hypothetical protein A3I88_00735 [Candidatus Portnoybacteria bacterium RIFCSPLOWO2_12_FULL_39_9]
MADIRNYYRNNNKFNQICQEWPRVLKWLVLVFLILTFVRIPIGRAGLIEDLKLEIEKKQKEIEELEKQAGAYKETITAKQKEGNNLKNQIAILNAQIKKLETDIRITQSRISGVSLKISGLNLSIEEQIQEITKQKQALGEIIQIIAEYDQETPFELVLKNDNFSDFLNQMEYVGLLQNQIQTKLEDIQLLKVQLEDEKTSQEEKQNELEELRSQLKGQNQVLGNQKDDKEDLLKTTKNQEWRYQNLLKEVEKKRQEIQKEIYELEIKLQLAIDPNSIPTPRPGILAWPTSGRITQNYGPTSQTGFINNVYSFHNGLDIASGLGTPVRAAQDGRIKGLGDNGKYAYGKWLAIEHGNGLTTLYAHLSAYAVSNGQEVRQGQIIGYEGATGFATGPHLHFTVYATNTFRIEERWFGLLPLGGSLNPFDYL